MSVEDLLVEFQYDESDLDDTEQNWARQYFLPGDVLKGMVSVHLRGFVAVRSLTLHLLGTASVSWEATNKRKVYQASEVHLEFAKSLLNTGASAQVIELGEGVHQFGFQYKLPADLPSSFQGVYGQVTYVSKVVLECVDERNTTITSEPFMVLRRPDLPDSAYEEVTLHKKRFFLGLKTGKVRIEATIDRSVAVPGDDVLVDAEVSNLTGRRINTIQAAIMQESRYRAQGHDLSFRQCLSKRDDVYDVSYVHGRRWHKIKLPVPPFLADSGLDKCTIMDVKYFFQFKVSVEGKDDILVETPLYVGSHHTAYSPEGRHLLLDRMWHGNSIDTLDRPMSAFYGNTNQSTSHMWHANSIDTLDRPIPAFYGNTTQSTSHSATYGLPSSGYDMRRAASNDFIFKEFDHYKRRQSRGSSYMSTDLRRHHLQAY